MAQQSVAGLKSTCTIHISAWIYMSLSVMPMIQFVVLQELGCSCNRPPTVFAFPHAVQHYKNNKMGFNTHILVHQKDLGETLEPVFNLKEAHL